MPVSIIGEEMKALLAQLKLSDYRHWLFRIVLLAVILRFVFYLFIYLPLEQDFGWYQDDNYDRVAVNLLTGYGYVDHPGGSPEIYRRPLYVFFLALLYKFFGEERWVLTVIQTLLQALTCIVIFRIALENFKDQAIALLSALGFALYPQPMLYVGRPYTEGLYIPLLAVFVLWYSRLFREFSKKNAFYSGISLGILNLIRPTMQPFFIFIYLGLAVYYVNRKREVLLKGTLIALTMFLVMAPWLIRNRLVAKNPASTVAQFGKAVLYNVLMEPPSLVLVDQHEERLRVAEKIEAMGLNRKIGVEDNRIFKVALLNLAGNWSKYLQRMVFEGMFFWYLGCSKTTSLINLIVHLPLLIFGVWGMWLANRRNILILPFVLLVAYFNLIHSFMAAGARLAFPVVPYLIIFTVYAIYCFYEPETKTANLSFSDEERVFL
jgi:hypothetical protein